MADSRPRRRERVSRRTCLLVGEGRSEKAFFKHLKMLYESRQGPAVNAENANGGSPNDVVAYALRQCKFKDFDLVLMLLDADIPYEPRIATQCRLNKHNAHILKSTPCLEGLLLTILDKPVPRESQECKRKLRKHMPEPFTNPRNFTRAFPRDRFDRKRESIRVLDRLIQAIEGIEDR